MLFLFFFFGGGGGRYFRTIDAFFTCDFCKVSFRVQFSRVIFAAYRVDYLQLLIFHCSPAEYPVDYLQLSIFCLLSAAYRVDYLQLLVFPVDYLQLRFFASRSKAPMIGCNILQQEYDTLCS